MFNFAVAGTLVKYQPVNLIDSAIKPVDPAVRIARLGNHSRDSHELSFKEDLAVSQEKISNAKSALIESYGRSAQREEKPRRRLWKVDELMTKTVRTLNPEDSLQLAWELMERTNFRHIPITNLSGRLEGLLSDRDLLPLNREQMNHRPISDIMTKRVLTCFANSPLRQAASIMIAEGFSSLPVINKNGELHGLLTTSDILKGLVREAPLDLWA